MVNDKEIAEIAEPIKLTGVKDVDVFHVAYAIFSESEWRKVMMNSAVEIMDIGFACLVEKLGVVNAERFIAMIKRDSFDYTI